MHLRTALLITLSLALAGCGSSSTKSTTPVSTGGISGNWQIELQPTNQKLNPGSQTGFLVQSKSAVTGGLFFNSNPCTGVGNVQGTVSENNVSLVTNIPVGVQVNLTGTIGAGLTSMTGTYTTLSTGCSSTSVAPAAGTWTANQIAALNGTYQGSLISSTGVTYATSATVTQASNTGASSAALSGMLTPTGYCFASANISGVISGTAVSVSLIDSTGAQVGQMVLSATIDGKTLTGTYNILATNTGIPPCSGGANGTVTLSM